ncbi:MAG: hypothetical protein M0T84_18565 [Betaproteobacteria bacterium]|nr:hypothetical protein [Betaproteobacteria bacterium]
MSAKDSGFGTTDDIVNIHYFVTSGQYFVVIDYDDAVRRSLEQLCNTVFQLLDAGSLRGAIFFHAWISGISFALTVFQVQRFIHFLVTHTRKIACFLNQHG